MTGFILIVNCSAAAARSLRVCGQVRCPLSKCILVFHPRQQWEMLQRHKRAARNSWSGVNSSQTHGTQLFINKQGEKKVVAEAGQTSMSFEFIPVFIQPSPVSPVVPSPSSAVRSSGHNCQNIFHFPQTSCVSSLCKLSPTNQLAIENQSLCLLLSAA